MRVLLVEDEEDLSAIICAALGERGIQVDASLDGQDGLLKAATVDYDAVILDLMLPVLDGYTVLKRLRATKKTPVLMLTARDSTDDKVTLLNEGADDYLTKPFMIDELAARIRAIVRRSTGEPSPLICIGNDLRIDTIDRRVTCGGQLVELTPTEYSILHLLATHADRIVTRQMIYDRIYGDRDSGSSNTIEVYLSNLRKKVGKERIETHRRNGYTLRA
ncbi:Response regulator ArlR [Novipirellula aureliae]|uniref:Response regulator ArlR n=1 Tax=Novipirellula aureliae TaxID=2527966 RepID=A0A5C6EE14_9BACT|nr:response regulator transcription factor [Novipirellula aureliae]TWU45459.1 Response regulator ArlR [Novipirellula aureliae]